MGKDRTPKEPAKPPPTGKEKGKEKDNKDATAKEKDTKGKGKGKVPAVEPPKVEEKKLQTWTGKTPVTHLNEWCQKNHHPRPRIDPTHVRGYNGPEPVFRCKVIVTLDLGNNKKEEKFFAPDFPSPSMMEARHVAAVVAMHGLNPTLPLYRVMAPEFRDLWFKLTEQHKQMQEEQKRFAEEEERYKQRELEKQARAPKHKHRPAQIFMSDEARMLVESVINELRKHRYTDLQVYELNAQSMQLYKTLVRMGFQPKDVDRALTTVNTLTEAMDWLCLNASEENLPKKFAPTKGNIQVMIFSKPGGASESEKDQVNNMGDLDDRRKAFAVAMLEWGFVGGECAVVLPTLDEALLEAEGEDYVLQEMFKAVFKSDGISEGDVDRSSLEEVREEEIVVLESIFGSDFESPNKSLVSVKMDLPVVGKSVIEFRFPPSSLYPNEIPTVFFKNQNIPAKLRRKIMEKMVEECANLLGGAMIYSLTLWLTTNIAAIDGNEPIFSPLLASKDKSATQSTLKGAPQQQLASTKSDKKGPEATPRKVNRAPVLSQQEKEELSKKLYEESLVRQKTEGYQKLKKIRERLPVFVTRERFLDTLAKNQVVVLTGETGSGKTTQIPQYIMEALNESMQGASCNMVCTQPRRIAAVSVAQRVSEEWTGAPGNVGGVIGYNIRHEGKSSASTRLLFCTTGILLRRLSADPELAGVSHVVVDEVHERNMDTDFLLILLRELLPKRRSNFKLVLMSATLDAKKFSNYFSGAPVFSVAGFTHPVTEYFLEDVLKITGNEYKNTQQPQQDEDEPFDPTDPANLTRPDPIAKKEEKPQIDYDVMVDLVWNIIDKKNQGAILVFMPGLAEILTLADSLENNPRNRNKQCCVYPLHSSLPPHQQEIIFSRPPPGKTKIIVSTNIAETSVTIDDVTVVIDSGLANQSQYEFTNSTNRLVMTYVSKAALRQRMGRAGRTSPGICYRMFYKTKLKEMADNELPEIVRAPLQQLCLQVKLLAQGYQKGIYDFLSKALDPPPRDSVLAAVTELRSLHAITGADESLTPLGHHLAQLPVDIYIGKLLLYGCVFRCIDPILTIAATLSHRSPFFRGAPIQSFENMGKSDMVLMWKAYDGWCNAKAMNAEKSYCNEKMLSIASLRTISELKIQFAEILGDIGFLPTGLRRKTISRFQEKGYDGILQATGELHNLNSRSIKMVRAIVCAGLYPHVSRVDTPEQLFAKTESGAMPIPHLPKDLRIVTKNNERVFMHPSSINFSQGDYESPWLVYHTKMQTSKLYIRETTMAPPYSLLLFSFGTSILLFIFSCVLGLSLMIRAITVQHERELVIVDDWIKFNAPARIAVLVKEIRTEFLQLLDAKIRDPSFDVSTSDLVDVVTKLIMNDGFL